MFLPSSNLGERVSETQPIEIRKGQRWQPQSGADLAREIEDIRAAGLRNAKWPMGTEIVCWVAKSDKWGWCSARSFRAWVRRTGARRCDE